MAESLELRFFIGGKFGIKTDRVKNSCHTAAFAWFGGGCNEVWVVNVVTRDEELMNSLQFAVMFMVAVHFLP